MWRRDQSRHDRILASSRTARHEYHLLLAALHGHLKHADHVVLIGHWIDDVQATILPRARASTDEVSEARWLALAESALQQVTLLMTSAQTESDEARRA